MKGHLRQNLLQLAGAMIGRGVELFKTDSLFRNAVFLMSSTAIMSVLGFFFWLFVAHFYGPAEIGAASALISISLLISNLSYLGLDSGLVRFLSASRKQSGDINAALITVGSVAALASVVYLFVGTAANLPFFVSGPAGWGAFVALMVAVVLNSLTDNIFIANRRAGLHTITYTVLGLTKLLLPLVLIPFGSLGVFLAYSLAALASLVLTFFFMWRYCGYRFVSKPNWNFIKEVRSFSANNYIGKLLSGLPSQLMPTLIIGRLGAAEAAFFSMAWTMANLLYIIPSATSNSLLAESSHDEAEQHQHIKHAIKILAAVLIPAVALAILVAPHLLKIFGAKYADNSTAIFQILALTTFPMAVNYVCNTIMNIQRRTGGLVLVQGVTSAVILLLALPLMRFGLPGVGLAILVGQVVGNVIQIALLARRGKSYDSQTARRFQSSQENVKRLMRAYGITQFGWRQLACGAESQTFLVTHGDKTSVLKVYDRPTRPRDKVIEELQFTGYLANQGVPVPKVWPALTHELVPELKIDGLVLPFILMEHAAGSHPEQYSSKLLANQARLQGQIHVQGIAYARGLEVCQAKRLGYDIKLRRLGLSRMLHKLPSPLRLPVGLSHFDIDASNVLVRGDKVTCVLDFEGMRYDPVVVCLIFTLSRLFVRLRDPEALERYLHVYQQERRLNRLERLVVRTALSLQYRSPRLAMLRF